MPNLSDFTKKLDIQGFVDSVKSAIGSSTVAKAPEGDEIAAKFVALSQVVQALVSAHAEQAKLIGAINNQLNALSKDWQLLQTAAKAPTAETPAATDTTTKTEEDKK
jgi:hypothetical protein